MRLIIVIVGIIVVIAGVVLWVVPLTQSGSKTINESTPAHFHVTEHVQLQSTQAVSASWSASASVSVVILTCSSINLNASSIWQQCTGGSNHTETGSSGSVSIGVPVGGYLWIGIVAGGSAGTNPSASVYVTTTLSDEAIGLWGLGALVAIIGLLLRRGKPRTAPAPVVGEASPATTPEPEPVADVPSTPPNAPEIPTEEPLN
jgi:hypothetical protein